MRSVGVVGVQRAGASCSERVLCKAEERRACASTSSDENAARCVLGVRGQWKESPQAQEPEAFGLSIVKPCFSMVSTKSMLAPLR